MNKQNCSQPNRLFDWVDKWIESAPKNFSELSEKEIGILKELAEQWKQRDQIAVLKSMYSTYGPPFADLIERVMKKKMLLGWQEESKNCESHNCQDLVRELWEPMQELGFEYTLKESDKGIQMNCTRCPYNDTVENDDDRKWLYHLFCSGDPEIVEGFNPRMGFKRTKTLIGGDDCCDHFYYMKD